MCGVCVSGCMSCVLCCCRCCCMFVCMFDIVLCVLGTISRLSCCVFLYRYCSFILSSADQGFFPSSLFSLPSQYFPLVLAFRPPLVLTSSAVHASAVTKREASCCGMKDVVGIVATLWLFALPLSVVVRSPQRTMRYHVGMGCCRKELCFVVNSGSCS